MPLCPIPIPIWASNVQQSVGAMSSHHISKWTLGVLSAFAQGEGMQVRICVQSMRQTRGVRGHASLGNFDFGPYIRRNLVEFHTNIVYHVLKLYKGLN